VRTREPIEGRQSFRGVLTSTDDNGIVVTTDDTRVHAITFDSIARAHYQHDFAPGGRSRAHPRRGDQRASRRSGAR
jgi:hypothetical protein